MSEPILGEIVFSERDGMTVATLRFPAIELEFYMAVNEPADVKRQVMGMLRDHEQIRGIFNRTGCLDWIAMEAACAKGRGDF